MQGVPLKEYLKHNSQRKLADAVGVTQGAISKMLRVGRNITVVESKGRVRLVEEKAIMGNRDD